MSFFNRSKLGKGSSLIDPSEERPSKGKKADPLDVLTKQSNTPAAVYEKGAAKFAEIYGSSKVEAARWFLMAILASLLAITAVATLAVVTPLKEVRPWVVEINPTTGIVNRPVQVERIDPNMAVVKAELARWVEAVYTIDPLRSSQLLRWANSRAADKAVGQFTEFRARERIFERIRGEADMVREVKVTAVDASVRGTAFIFITTTERVGSAPPAADKIRRYRVTLNYRLTPATQEADLLANPLGILVTFFSDAEERAL
jgi:type IV secretory pathway component VirB8